MASKLQLDKADPDVAALIADWINGSDYEVTLSIRQTASSDKSSSFDVLGISEGGEAVLDDEGPPAKPPPTPKQAIPISYRK